MSWRERWKIWRRTHVMRHCLFVLGWLLVVISPLAGLLPGPGGVFIFAAGMALVLETSPWAKRVYVRAKRRWPRIGGWLDWGLRRRSEKRRRARAKLAEATAGD